MHRTLTNVFDIVVSYKGPSYIKNAVSPILGTTASEIERSPQEQFGDGSYEL